MHYLLHSLCACYNLSSDDDSTNMSNLLTLFPSKCMWLNLADCYGVHMFQVTYTLFLQGMTLFG